MPIGIARASLPCCDAGVVRSQRYGRMLSELGLLRGEYRPARPSFVLATMRSRLNSTLQPLRLRLFERSCPLNRPGASALLGGLKQ